VLIGVREVLRGATTRRVKSRRGGDPMKMEAPGTGGAGGA